MSPIAFNSFRFTDSTLDLNGPSLSFSEQPSDTTVSIGDTITLSGISTLSITPFTGTINYQWYNSADGTAVSNGERTNESGSISTITGATSENLSIINAQYQEDDGDSYYLEASYTPAGYGSDTIGNPANEPLNSNSAKITVPFTINIDVQPASDDDAIASDFTEFTIVASTSANDPTFDSRLTYQWSLDGTNLSNSSTVEGSNTDTLSIARGDVGSFSIKCTVGHEDSAFTVDSDVVAYVTKSATGYLYSESITNRGSNRSRSVSNFNLGTGPYNKSGAEHIQFLYSPNEDLDVIIEMTSASGNSYDSYAGGKGGWGVFRLKMLKNVEYSLKLGSKNGLYGPIGGRVASPANGAQGGGMGILYKQNRPIAVLGAGGGAGNSGNGGDGGGLNIDGQRGGGRNGGSGGVGGPSGRGSDNFTSTQRPTGSATAACISNSGSDYFRDTLGLSDCIDYWTYYNGKVHFRDHRGLEFNGQGGVPTSTQLFRGWRQGSAGRGNAGWGKNGNGGGGGGGAFGGDGAAGNQSGGGGGSGYANTGEVDVLRTSSGAWDGNAYIKIQLYTDLLAQDYRNGLYDLGAPADNIQQIEWNDSRNLGYKQGTESESQTNSGSKLNTGSGSQTNPTNANWIEKITADNGLVRSNKLFLYPEGTNASNLSYFMFNLLYKSVKHKTSDNSYLITNRGNRDSSRGTTRRWYTESQSLLNSNSELYTNDKDEAFIPYRLEFSMSLSFDTGGKWKVLTIPFGQGGLSYDFTTFDSRNDINFNSNQFAKYFDTPEARGILTDFNEVDPAGDPRYNYSNPKIEYIRSRIIDLDTNRINDLNLFMEFDNEDGAVDDNFVEIGKYFLT